MAINEFFWIFWRGVHLHCCTPPLDPPLHYKALLFLFFITPKLKRADTEALQKFSRREMQWPVFGGFLFMRGFWGDVWDKTNGYFSLKLFVSIISLKSYFILKLGSFLRFYWWNASAGVIWLFYKSSLPLRGLRWGSSLRTFHSHVFNHFNECLKEAKSGKLCSVY